MADRRFVLTVAVLYLSVCLLPNFFGMTLAGNRFYTGFDLNSDDMCVYMAWMEQARRGNFLFDNRFTNEEQPRLTVHLLFYVLGTVSRVTGLYHGTVFHAARLLFGLLFLLAAWRLVCAVTKERRARRLAFGVLLVSAGFGWMMSGMKGVMGPTDLWQPEGFTFPSLLHNALFACALWLMAEVWLAVLAARDSWRAVPWGFVAMLLLANVHTYDVVTIVLVAVAFAAALWGSHALRPVWALRASFILIGAVPPVLWLAYVRSADPVFAARAATHTFSPEPWQFVVGYLPLILLAAVGVGSKVAAQKPRAWTYVPALAPLLLLATIAFTGCPLNRPPENAIGNELFLGAERLALFGIVFILLCGAAWSIGRAFGAEGRQRPAILLMAAWAAVALWLPYFPALFQRKLTMGAHIPLAVLAGLAILELLQRLPTRARGTITVPALALTVLSLSNLVWLRNSLDRIASNLSSTQVHPVYLSAEHLRLLTWMRDHLPEDATAQDLLPYACFIPALAGQRVYAGHWSETPQFPQRIGVVIQELYGGELEGLRYVSVDAAKRLGLQYVVARKLPPDSYWPDEPPVGTKVEKELETLALLRVEVEK